MKSRICITVVVENTARRPGTLGEHGFACWIEAGTQRVLFDTGQGQTLAHNASHLQIDLAHANAIVLSHGHFDHTGGLRYAYHLAGNARLFLHPQVLCRRYSCHNGRGREIGLASMTEPDICMEGQRLVWTTQPTEVVSGVFVTGEIPRQTDYEDTGGSFFLDADCHEPDPIRDDQALYVDTDAGIVVVLGCAHAGVVNTLNYIRVTTRRPIHAVIGGTHLVNASPQRLTRTIAALRDMNIQIIAPAHCTGPYATAALWTAFPDEIADCSVGTQWTFSRHS